MPLVPQVRILPGRKCLRSSEHIFFQADRACAIHVPSTFACSHGSPLHGTNLSGRAAMTTASPSLHETAIAYPPRRPRGSGTAISRGSGRLTLHARFGYKHWPAMLVRRRRWLNRASGLCRRRPGGCDMGLPGPTHLRSLLLAVALIAATCGFIASAVVRRNKRRARGFFLLGFFCGLLAGAILHGRRRGLNALGAVARCADVRPLRAGIRRGTGSFAARALTFAASHVRLGLSPPQWHRQLRM